MRVKFKLGTRDLSIAAGCVVALGLAACTSKAPSANGSGLTGAVQVVSTDAECQVGTATAGSGNVVFDVRNAGNQVTEFYVFAADGLQIMGEVENIGPGITRKLVATLAPGSYLTACKPGLTGDGIRAPFTVTDSGVSLTPSGEFADQLKAATDQYTDYVREQSDQLLDGTRAFALAYRSGDLDAARAMYASTRMHWERIEPVAESFGDLDPKLDAREADLETGQTWTGWHRIEKDLWPPTDGYVALAAAERVTLADQLAADTEELHRRVATLSFTAAQLGNGAKELLDEVATGKVTGEEEIWSHTDLWDFQANVDGARIAFEVLKPVVQAKDPALATQLTTAFADVQRLLDSHRLSGEGDTATFKLYTELTPDEIKQLADAVNATGEPLSKLTAAVVL